MNESVISTKGQVVIPAAFRKRYGLGPNRRVVWVDSGGTLSLYPHSADPVAASRGILKLARATLAALQEDRRREKTAADENQHDVACGRRRIT